MNRVAILVYWKNEVACVVLTADVSNAEDVIDGCLMTFPEVEANTMIHDHIANGLKEWGIEFEMPDFKELY